MRQQGGKGRRRECGVGWEEVGWEGGQRKCHKGWGQAGAKGKGKGLRCGAEGCGMDRGIGCGARKWDRMSIRGRQEAKMR